MTRRRCVWPMGDEDDAPPCNEPVPWQRADAWMALCDQHEIEWLTLLDRLAGKGATVTVERNQGAGGLGER